MGNPLPAEVEALFPAEAPASGSLALLPAELGSLHQWPILLSRLEALVLPGTPFLTLGAGLSSPYPIAMFVTLVAQMCY